MVPPTGYKPPNREICIEICIFQAHLRWSSVFFWLLPWGKHFASLPPNEKMLQKGGTIFGVVTHASWTTQVNQLISNATFCGSKVLFFPPAFDSRQKTVPYRGVRGSWRQKKPYRFVPHSMALISWLLRWGVVLVTVATECDEGVSMGSWGKRVGLVCVLTNVAFTLW